MVRQTSGLGIRIGAGTLKYEQTQRGVRKYGANYLVR